MNEFSDANWFSLERSIKDGNVIPVIGPDALIVEFKDQSGSRRTELFYRLVTADLLKTFQVEPQSEILENTWALHKAVTAILASKRGPGIEQRIRREVSRLVAHYSNIVQPAESLRLLAGIRTFTLFVSLTPDNLLERAITTADDSQSVHVSTFSPRDASESMADPAWLRQGERGIFQILGTCTNVGSGFAMHEEDALEHLYRLQSDAARRITNILSELRRRDKLFIGCNLPDWFGRTLIRLLSDSRLSTKGTLDFFLLNTNDAELNDIFLSYAREDRERVAKLAEALELLNFKVFWDPKIRLGEQWDKRIETELDNSRCVVAVWSQEAVKSDWVRTEAKDGLVRKILIPLRLDEVKPPLEFRHFIQTADFTCWNGKTDAEEFLKLVDAIREKLRTSTLVTAEKAAPLIDMQHSPNTLILKGRPEELIKKLAQSFGTISAPAPKPPTNKTNSRGPTVFVSYASENAESARRIADTLLSLGFSDVWLDKKKLIGGDDWSDRLDEAIVKSDFFLPVLSREADGRREGVFWDEWKTALERARRIKGAYLLPVGIDPEPPSRDRYRRISDGDTAGFFDKHLIHAPGGALQTEDRERLKELCHRLLEADQPNSANNKQIIDPLSLEFFISYSRTTDFLAAEQLYQTLQELGLDESEIWFDRTTIEPGGDFQKLIYDGIRSCRYFLPLISAGADRFDEKFFYREWNAAIDRSKGIIGREFIVPIILDEEYNPQGYVRVPKEWSDTIDFGHAPGGMADARTRQHLIKLIRELRRGEK